MQTDHESLRSSEALYRSLVEASQVLIWRCDLEGRYTFLNKAWERTLGVPLGELLGRTLEELASSAEGDTVQLVTRDGREFFLHFEATLIHDAEGRVIGSEGTARDVTERRQREACEAWGREVLRILNGPGSLHEAIEQVLSALRAHLRCDAVGIRLQEGDDFPYFVQQGFPHAFVEMENSLTCRDRKGACRDAEGHPCLECTCGLVIAGTQSPLLTPSGSFWTNDSVALLELPTSEDPRAHARNECIHFGYLSVALVPIRSQEKIVGLVQLNDRRLGRFSAQTVEALEDVASHIGEALIRKAMETALRESEQKLRQYQERLRSMAFDAAVVQERERRRIAVDLHDSIGQALALAQIKLSTVRARARGTPRAAIEEVVPLLAQTIVDSRSLVFALSPPVLYDLGLSAATSWLVEDLESKHGLKVKLKVHGTSAPLDETTGVVVFRAVRELLMNVLKHAGTLEAKVSIHQTRESLEVVVSDEGKGFEAEALSSVPHGSFGLFSLREQMSRIGGSVELTSSKGHGTQARVRVTL